MVSLEEIQQVAIERGFFIPTAEIYGGIAGEFDYGPFGVLLKRKIIALWRRIFIQEEDSVWEIDGNVILPYRVLEASGHVENFVEPVTQCTRCKTVYRADKLIEEKLGVSAEGLEVKELEKLISEHGLRCPKCGGTLSPIRVLNVMFELTIGATGRMKGFLRPETAQNIFVNFNRVRLATGASLPFGIAQIGKSFRNEISPRQFLYRLREFTQMEIEFFGLPEIFERFEKFEEVADVRINFVPAKEASGSEEKVIRISLAEGLQRGYIPNKFFAYLLAKTLRFYRELGIPEEDIRFREIPENEKPFYSKKNIDVEIRFSIGWREVEGTAYRTDYDLSRHSEYSKVKLMVQYGNKMVIPEVIEVSFGVERTILAVLEKHYRPAGFDRKWSWFAFPPKIAPVSVAVLPLLSKSPFTEKAYEIFRTLKRAGFDVIFDKKGSIGKRYSRADEIGVPFCVTVDHRTFEDDTVTLRDRDSKAQIRVPVSELMGLLNALIHEEVTFSELMQKYEVVRRE